jgi:hypothetical protein
MVEREEFTNDKQSFGPIEKFSCDDCRGKEFACDNCESAYADYIDYLYDIWNNYNK